MRLKINIMTKISVVFRLISEVSKRTTCLLTVVILTIVLIFDAVIFTKTANLNNSTHCITNYTNPSRPQTNTPRTSYSLEKRCRLPRLKRLHATPRNIPSRSRNNRNIIYKRARCARERLIHLRSFARGARAHPRKRNKNAQAAQRLRSIKSARLRTCPGN